MADIEKNLETVRSNIKKAAERAGRNPQDITLITVTKNFDVSCINRAIDCGIKDAGENRVQEMLSKIDTVKAPLNWHVIGHLQTNKVKYIVDKVKMIHSVDTVKLLKEISKEAKKHSVNCDVLLEVNIAGEESKFGLNPATVYEMVEEGKNLDNICIRGLMTVAPYVEDPNENRPYFKQMYELFQSIKETQSGHMDMQYLSMGMSGDYEVAIEEGANMVRVGSAIFGKRDYSKKL